MAEFILSRRRRARTVAVTSTRISTPVEVSAAWLAHERIVIGGAPRAGKTTLSLAFERPVSHTDDLIQLGWSQASEEAACWTMRPGPWVIEGVAAGRALRKALRMSTAAPCDLLIWLSRPVVAWTTGQASMAKVDDGVLAEIEPALLDRGVVIIKA